MYLVLNLLVSKYINIYMCAQWRLASSLVETDILLKMPLLCKEAFHCASSRKEAFIARFLNIDWPFRETDIRRMYTNMTIGESAVSCPTRWNLVGGGDPLWADVNHSERCHRLVWPFKLIFFAQKRFPTYLSISQQFLWPILFTTAIF